MTVELQAAPGPAPRGAVLRDTGYAERAGAPGGPPERLADARPADPGVAWALGRLARGDAVGDLARELGWSHRRLIARFRDGVGLAPKLVARILRFERLTALIEREPAVGCGYFDQAHLAREVRDLAGVTPTALRSERVNSVQDPEAP